MIKSKKIMRERRTGERKIPVGFYLTPNINRLLGVMAALEERSASSIVEEAIIDYWLKQNYTTAPESTLSKIDALIERVREKIGLLQIPNP